MKISTKLFSASAIALLALSSSTSVLAETTPSTATSHGKIGLIVDPDTSHPGGGEDGGDGTDPTDPTDPNYPGDGNGNDNTGNKGDFTLDVVPNYDFGIQKIDGSQLYNALFWDSAKGAVVEGRNSNPYVQVTDLREENTGWNVTVAMTKAFNTDVEGQTGKGLNGAILSLPQGEATPVDSTNTSTAPTTMAIGNGKTVGVNGDAATLMSADANAGTGSWMDKMYDDPANNTKPTTLFVPAGNTAGTYTAELTWTLSDAPRA
ncbi:hypothetical protein RD055328_12260 [Companilactobacillus sp. RD055328]|uniref:WxL domain-containing protein n=1 Tax=Companilactobacillus sp. RD055328 TaxID=2916634 RepID=UPI001FC7C687|nr:WxL domain-containing protein [Companilactobacillus sp. RD055328]GKQ43303.1 hypothetical protein RD055328_12260 [Companilactobacillus sp. RD055328]